MAAALAAVAPAEAADPVGALLTVGVSLVGVAAAGFTWGAVEAKAFTLRTADVPALAPGAEPFTVLHLSDLHLTPSQDRKRAWVRSLAAHRPDLVIVTGDMLAHREAVPSVLEAFTELLEAPGAFVLGSNDYFEPKPVNPFKYFWGPSKVRKEPAELPTQHLVDGLTGAGWLDLTNTRGVLEAAGRTFSFVGVDDPHLNRDVMPAPGGPRGDVHLGVAHAPYTRVLDAFAADGADAIIAGHTHGGQVCVPFYGALVTNCDLDRKRVKGLHGWPGERPDRPGGEHSTWLHVSAGVGTSPYAQVRFACRPEATLLRFVPRSV